MRGPLLLALLALLLATGCDSDPPDGSDAGGTDAGEPPRVAPLSAPRLAPCPEGWTEQTSSTGLVHCEPWPAGGPEDCAVDAIHLAGTPGCARVGTECPAGDFPTDLPAGAPVIYVSAGAAAGGDGSESAPFSDLSAVAGRAAAGSVIAIGKGRYEGNFMVRPDVTLVGACVAETVLTSSSTAINAAVLGVTGGGSVIRNLSIVDPAQPAVLINGAASTTIEDVVIDGATFGGITVAGGTLEMRRSSVRNMRPRPIDGVLGVGIVLFDGSDVTLERVTLVRSSALGFGLDGTSANAVLEDVVIRDTQPAVGGPGTGIDVTGAARIELRRAVIQANHVIGIWLHDGAGDAILEDVVVRGTLPLDGAGGYGVGVDSASRFEASRLLVEDSGEQGVVAQLGATLLLDDAIIRRTTPDEDGLSGRGCSLSVDVTAQLRRVAFEDHHDIGLFARGNVSLVAEDLIIRGTRARAADRLGGRGLEVSEGGMATVTRGLFEDNRAVSVSAWNGTPLRLHDVIIARSLPRACAEDGSCDPAGHGLGVYAGASATVEGFEIRAADLCGVQIDDSELDLTRGLVTGNAIGACVQVDGYDFDRLSNDVDYVDNGANLEATTLPLPDASFDGVGP